MNSGELSADGNYFIWNGTITIPGGSMSSGGSGGNWNICVSDSGPFTAHSPKSDAVKAVKLTKDNLRTVGAHILKTLGGGVDVGTDRIVWSGGVAEKGDWLIEGYDYVDNVVTFAVATQAQRQRYDLR